jgi:hypothetical protein
MNRGWERNRGGRDDWVHGGRLFGVGLDNGGIVPIKTIPFN